MIYPDADDVRAMEAALDKLAGEGWQVKTIYDSECTHQHPVLIIKSLVAYSIPVQ